MSEKSGRAIARFVDVKRHAAEAAEAEHAEAQRERERREQACASAEARWLDAVSGAAAPRTAGDLEAMDMHVRGLKRAVEHAHAKLVTARKREALAREDMVKARTELKRFETWLERERAARANAERIRERKAEDAVAARRRSVG